MSRRLDYSRLPNSQNSARLDGNKTIPAGIALAPWAGAIAGGRFELVPYLYNEMNLARTMAE